MAMTSASKHHEIAQTNIHEAIKDAITRTDVVIVSNMNDFMSYEDQHKVLEQAIDNYVKDATDHLVKLKTRLNTLVLINRLPVELFAHIIRLTNPQKNQTLREYVSYTWVCHHWRSVLVQTADFWTLFQLDIQNKPMSPFIHELLERSRLTKLDVTIYIGSINNGSILENFLAKAGNRIHTLWIEGHQKDLQKLVLKTKHLLSLQRVVFRENWGWITPRPSWVPILTPSDNLETLECGFGDNISVGALNGLQPVFNRIRMARLDIRNPGILPFVLNALHNNVRLHALQLNSCVSHPIKLSNQINIPDLRFLSINDQSLLEDIRAPKLSSIDVLCTSPINFDNPIFKHFGYSSIKYLHIFERESFQKERMSSIVGFKEPIHPVSRNSLGSEKLGETACFFEDVDRTLDNEDILSNAWPARDYFRLRFFSDEVFKQTVKVAFHFILPQLAGLMELCLESRILVRDMDFQFNEVLAQLPSLERLIVLSDSYGDETYRIIDFIYLFYNDPSMCPRLNHLCYMACYDELLPERKDLKGVAEEVGELLTDCIRERRKGYSDALKNINLPQCPPLPKKWRKELKQLGTTVVTENSIKYILECLE